MDMLYISNLYKRFSDKKVLNGLNLSVPEHSIFGFIGKNGAGKTTTMKMVLGLLKADTGEIIVIRTRQFWAKVKGVAVKDFSKDFNMTSKYVTKAVFNTPHRKAYSCALTMEDAAIELASLLVQRGKRYGVKLKTDKTHE